MSHISALVLTVERAVRPIKFPGTHDVMRNRLFLTVKQRYNGRCIYGIIHSRVGAFCQLDTSLIR